MNVNLLTVTVFIMYHEAAARPQVTCAREGKLD